MKTALPWLLVFALITGCSSTWHLKQAERHLRKAEQLGINAKTDTVFVTKEIIVPEVKYDTLLKQVNFTDTITVIKDNIVTKLKVDTRTKEVYIAVKCPSDTLKIEVPVTVTKTIETDFPWGWVVLAFFGGSALGLFATRKR